MKKLILWALAITMAAGLLSACGPQGGKKEKAGETTTLNVMLVSNKPNKMDEVLEEFYRRTGDSLNIKLEMEWTPNPDHKEKLKLKMAAGEECDLVFDAPWQTLKAMVRDGAYQPLESYFDDDRYPALRENFDPEMLKANYLLDHLYSVPVMRAYGAGVDCVMYRQDLADSFGIGKIDSYQKLEAYFQAIQANEPKMTPIGLTAHRGFFHMFEADAVSAYEKNVLLKMNVGNNLWFNVCLAEDGKSVKSIAAFGDPDSAYADFPEPYQTDPLINQFVKTRQWNQYTEKDSINQKDSQALFIAGKAAAYIDTLDAYENVSAQISTSVPGSSLGTFVYVDRVRNMENGAVISNFMANNAVAVPVTSTKIDRTMEFLNWLFSSKDNHDLFELGIEGTHWTKVGDDKYSIPDEIDPIVNYNFPGWTMTWNPNFVRFLDTMPDDVLQYRKYEIKKEAYVENKLLGFSFDSEPIKVELARLKPIIDEVLVPMYHGILEDPVSVKQENTKKLRQNGLDVVEAEYVRQLNEFLASK